MNKAAYIVSTVTITVIILASLAGVVHVAWILDDCEAANVGHSCHIIATPEPRP